MEKTSHGKLGTYYENRSNHNQSVLQSYFRRRYTTTRPSQSLWRQRGVVPISHERGPGCGLSLPCPDRHHLGGGVAGDDPEHVPCPARDKRCVNPSPEGAAACTSHGTNPCCNHVACSGRYGAENGGNPRNSPVRACNTDFPRRSRLSY
jgi:hypothetical protein